MGFTTKSVQVSYAFLRFYDWTRVYSDRTAVSPGFSRRSDGVLVAGTSALLKGDVIACPAAGAIRAGTRAELQR